MEILKNFSLKKYNTFKIDAIAENYVSVKNVRELIEVLKMEGYKEKFILGGGSNILITQEIKGLVIHINIKGIKEEVKENNITEVERVNQNKIFMLTSSNLTGPSTQYPAYVLDGMNITVYPSTITAGGAIQTQYIRYPLAPNWTYLTTSGNDPIFNSTAADYQNFELPASDEPNLVAKILQYIGIEIREEQVYKFGIAEELTDTQETS